MGYTQEAWYLVGNDHEKLDFNESYKVLGEGSVQQPVATL